MECSKQYKFANPDLVQNGFDPLLTEGEQLTCDVTFSVGCTKRHFISLQLQDGKSIRAHRFVLEMTSPWFKGASWLSSPLSNISINTFSAVEEV